MKSKGDLKRNITEILRMNEPHGPIWRTKRGLVIALGAIAVLAALIIFGTGNKSAAPRYKTEQAKKGALTVIVTATGTLQPTNSVEVGSELSGTVKSVEADYNSRVKIGQILVKLDTTKLEATITQSKAALESAKAKVLQARATVVETKAKLAQLRRVRELSRNKVPSQADMDAAEAAFDRAGADEANCIAAVSQARATLQANETDLSKSVIRSPINGIVLTRSIEPGQTVTASMTTPVLFTLAEDLSKMDLLVDVDEADVGKVREGQSASFSIAAYPDRMFKAKVAQVRYGSSTTSGVVTYKTVLKVDNADLFLRPGMTATADIIVMQIENAVLIPGSALRFTPPAQVEEKKNTGLVGALLPRPPSSGSRQPDDAAAANKKQQRVWILKNDQISAVPVTIGATSGNWTEVKAGDLQPGMEVVVDVLAEGK